MTTGHRHDWRLTLKGTAWECLNCEQVEDLTNPEVVLRLRRDLREAEEHRDSSLRRLYRFLRVLKPYRDASVPWHVVGPVVDDIDTALAREADAAAQRIRGGMPTRRGGDRADS